MNMIKKGYRNISMKNKEGGLLSPAGLFVQIKIAGQDFNT